MTKVLALLILGLMIIQLIKNSALASLIAVNEVSMIATILVSETFKPLEVFSVLAVLYLAIVVPLTLVGVTVPFDFPLHAAHLVMGWCMLLLEGMSEAPIAHQGRFFDARK